MRKTRRIVTLILGLLLLAAASPAYYHFIHYTSRFSPYTPIPEKFNLDALPGRVLQVFVSDQGPVQLAAMDTFEAVASQIHLATSTWNNVGTSDLRVAYAGLFTPGTSRNAPGVEIVFEEVPPGLVAMGGPTVWGETVNGASGSYVTINRSMVIVRNDLSQKPSYSEGFFTTMVHELGHALGLQHSLTSATMSTDYTRATTRGRSLATDDMVAISLLYPARDFLSSTGSISGRVSTGGEGVHLASVVALPPNGTPVSALTNPDGSYRIDGLPVGPYYVYVHPLPPTELASNGIRLPVDADGQPVAAASAFVSQFYPGTRDAQQASAMSVNAGMTIEGVDFAVERRSYVPLYAVTTYSYPGQTAAKPAFLSDSMMTGGTRNFLVAGGAGLISDGQPAAGLSVSVLGGALMIPSGGVKAYSVDTRYLRVDFQYGMIPSEGARHLVFSIPGDMYVLPSGVTLTGKLPPSITSVATGLQSDGTRVVKLGGTNLSASTSIFFDGVRVPILGVDETTKELLVAAPPASGDYRAIVTALNTDAQSSLFLQANAPATYTYDAAQAASFTVSPAALPAGTEAMVEITGIGTNFQEGQTVVGFGSPDVFVRRLWVLSPTRILANVAVSANAAVALTQVSVTSGLQIASLPYGFQIQAADSSAPIVSPTVVNVATGQALVCAGCAEAVAIANFSAMAGLSGFNITIGDKPATVISANEAQVTIQVPADLPLGPAVLRLHVGAMAAQPIVIMIEPHPPAIMSVGEKPFVTTGDMVTVTASGLGDSNAEILTSRVSLSVGGVQHPAVAVTSVAAQPGVYQVQFVLSSSVAPGAQVPLTLTFDGRISPVVPIVVQAKQTENQ
jgi:uncharacterized protein (TIGR03437 family)